MIKHDLHVHTPFSNCGKIKLNYLKTIYETYKEKEYVSSSELRRLLVDEALKEYISKAENIGLKILGFTDHYNIDTNPGIFNILREKTQKINNKVIILVGTETDIIDEYGTPLVPREVAEELDYVISGQHHYSLSYINKPPTENFERFLDYCFKDIINTMKNPIITGIGHPWLRAIRYYTRNIEPKIFFKEIPLEYLYKTCEYSEKYDKPIQIDYSPEWETSNNIYRGYIKFIEVIASHECRIFYGSDAHRPDHLARNLEYVNKILEKYNIDKKRIWNPEPKKM